MMKPGSFPRINWNKVLEAAPRGRTRALTTVALVLFTLVGYQNCGNDFVASNSVAISSVSSSECAATLQGAFQQSFHPFLSTTCHACHVPNGAGKGAFASTDLSVAFNAFMLVSASAVEKRALETSHAPGITGVANQSAIAAATAIWNSAQAACGGTGGGPKGLSNASVTVDKPIHGSAAVQTIMFNLDTDIVGSNMNYGGAKFSVGIQEVTNVSGDTLYYFTNPTLIAGSKPIHVGKMIVRLNGVNQPLMTTWTQLNFNVLPTVSQNMCTTTATNPFAFAASDTVGISFGELQTTN